MERALQVLSFSFRKEFKMEKNTTYEAGKSFTKILTKQEELADMVYDFRRATKDIYPETHARIVSIHESILYTNKLINDLLWDLGF